MPTNLPPEYFEVERRYKAAQTNYERVMLLEELIGTIPKHKGTDKLRADLRKRLSKLKAAAEHQKGSSRRDSLYHVDREGAGQVAIIGGTNTGKSSLLAALTNAEPEIADYPFTTQVPMPGMMPFDNVMIQLIDTPPLSRDYADPQLLNMLRHVDVILLVVDLQGFPIETLEDVSAVLRDRRIVPLHMQAPAEDAERILYKPVLVVVNKWDDESCDGDFDALCELLCDEWPLVPVSTLTNRNLETLKEELFQLLDVVRIYSKPPGEEPDFTAPFVLHSGGTVEEFAAKVHRDFVENLKSARVWGSAQHDGQMVGRDYVLCDGDIVELKT